MKKHIGTVGVGVAAALGISLVAPTRGEAELVLDLRAVGVNGVMFPTPTKGVGVAPGDTVNLRLYAVVSGTNGVNDEQVHNLFGSVVSTGGALGNMSGGVTPPFDGFGSQNGAQVDLDADGDLDIGAPANSASSDGFFFARSNLPTDGSVIDANSEEIEVGHFDWTVSATASGEFLLNFIVRVAPDGSPSVNGAVWYEDGAVKNPTLGSYRAGPPVLMPEPGAGLAAGTAAAAATLRRRRRRG